jgi:hypothetical protein
MTLDYFNQMYEDILQLKLSISKRDGKLAQLMTLMEQTFKIPMLRNLHWEEENNEVISLYRTISYSRKLKG